MSPSFESPRLRRLRSDHKAMAELASVSTVFSFRTSGDPPDHYTLSFEGPGTYLDAPENRIQLAHRHVVEVRLGAEYPRIKPALRWCTPIHHPNIAPSGAVCMGGYTSHWVPSVSLATLCEMLWDMLRYANFDVRNPFNAEAARWARDQRDFVFPLSNEPLRNRLAGSHTPPPAPTSAAPSRAPGVEGIVFVEDDETE